MMKPAVQLWKDDRGLIISAELILVLTVAVLAMVVGLNSMASAVNQELNDLSSAFGSLDQSYFYQGLSSWGHASVTGSGYVDGRDLCDCAPLGASIHSSRSGATGYIGMYVPPQKPVPGSVIPTPCVEEPCPSTTTPCPGCETPCPGCETTDTPLKPIPDKTPLPKLQAPPPAPNK